ncbi:N-acetylglucosamine-6-phosphate deacetylase [Novosphingobium sp. PC22D]|uniref:N-acetylglucosamine-6-phosphate deacetylase n=1 Tax=Novosphingobium sp. PC22D TaxID=1962403 RepID=UPI000BEF2F1A|nr:N-acetylglucosamine-6-phosphate deacetylase [Novosphingobium sp. PC22D]PEQ14338.1 N-acetylglucosamine-6-phosphate deacetylase [Novosphingobium sp. PC22D]
MIGLSGARIVTPTGVVEDRVLMLDGDRIAGLLPEPPPGECEMHDLRGGWLLPGFIDTQVNGGGDVLLNDRPTLDGVRTIAAAHRRFGTTGLLPTLVSGDLALIAATLEAIDAAIAAGVPGVLGAHIEGPFIALAKRGIHPAASLRPLDEEALDLLCRPRRGARVVTLAPELAPPGAIARLRAAGVIVAAGHSMADYETSRAAIAEGLCGFTHLFNAMTPLTSREPGMVGAALDDRRTIFGLIADGEHVHPASLRAAIRARGEDGAMLVTDAMPPVGGSAQSFDLGEAHVMVRGGRLVDATGTLGGSLLTMAQALRNARDLIGLPIETASRLASGNPARFLDMDGQRGAIAPGLAADLVHLDENLRVTATWIAGARNDMGEV